MTDLHNNARRGCSKFFCGSPGLFICTYFQIQGSLYYEDFTCVTVILSKPIPECRFTRSRMIRRFSSLASPPETLTVQLPLLIETKTSSNPRSLIRLSRSPCIFIILASCAASASACFFCSSCPNQFISKMYPTRHENQLHGRIIWLAQAGRTAPPSKAQAGRTAPPQPLATFFFTTILYNVISGTSGSDCFLH